MQFSRKHDTFKRVSSVTLSVVMLGTSFAGLGSVVTTSTSVDAAVYDYGLADTSQEGVILHCWNWSYNNIKKYMKDIAAAGYTSVQTSPVTQPKDYYWEGVAYGNVGIPDGTGDADHGNWWKVYQPVTMSICDNGYTWFGTKEEFKEMCDEAEKYGIRVIVDIVANHMGNIKGWIIGSEEKVMSDISPQIGEFWNEDMLTDSSYWHISDSWVHSSDGRYDVTQGNMGMPDLNTGDSKVQQMVLNLLKECIDCGADGFRFDAAKHIETPADDPAFASDFWNVVLDGAKSYYQQKNGNDNIYFYGEVLNRLDDTNAEAYYRSKMSLTDNSTSDNMRNSAIYGQASGLAISGYCGYIAGQGNKAVLWAESHDTYMGGGSSYDANDKTINQTWAIVASRKDSTGLYFARPYYSKDILANDVNQARQSDEEILKNVDYTQMGDVGSLTWASPSVVAVNRFRNFFVGQSENIGSSGNIAYNVRGNSGIVISKLDGTGSISLKVSMKDGTYTDQVTGEKFTVSGGVLTGNVTGEDGVAVIYNPTTDYGSVNPEEPMKLSASPSSGTSFSTDTLDVTINAVNAASASYTTSEGASGSFTGSKTITVGSTLGGGESVTVTITATDTDGNKKTSTYTYNKKASRTGYPTLDAPGFVFDNETVGWTDVYAYIYNDAEGKNAAWPGIKMTEVDGNYWTYTIPSKFTDDVYVIFNNGSGSQTPGSGQTGFAMGITDKMLFENGEWIELPESQDPLVNNSTISQSTITQGTEIILTGNASGGTAPYKFAMSAKHSTDSDYTVLKTYNTTSTEAWTPSKTGTYTISIKVKDSTGTIVAKTFTLTVNAAESTLTNDSTVSARKVTKGTEITLTGKASGGTSPYQYAMLTKHSTDSSWTVLKSYNTTATKKWTPSKTGTYKVAIKVKDSTGEIVEKLFDLTVNAASLTNNSTISATTITKGTEITMTGSASGGTSPYQYAMLAKHSTDSSWTVLKGYNTTATKKWTPAKTGTYKVAIKVKDSAGNIVEKLFNLTVNAASLTNNSTISAATITKGTEITMTGSASGGTSPYQYAMLAKHSTDSSWTVLKGYNTTATKKWTPAKTGTYKVAIKVKDSAGNIVEKLFNLTVNAAGFTNNSTISATTITKGTEITMTGSASGGTSPYQYQMVAKHSTDSSWTVLKDYSTTATKKWTPAKTGTYKVAIKVKDSTGKVVEKLFTLTVK